jgi:hypothetical protein
LKVDDLQKMMPKNALIDKTPVSPAWLQRVGVVWATAGEVDLGLMREFGQMRS